MENLETRVIETEQRSKSNSHRLDKVKAKIEDISGIVTALQVMSQRMGTMDGEIKEVRKDIKALVDKPAKRWEAIVAAAIGAIVAGLIAYAFFKLGLKP